jgi:hypothetical protein
MDDMKMLEVRCARCGTTHFSGEEHVGKMLKCSKCGDAVPIERAESKVSAHAIATNERSKDKVVSPRVPARPLHSLRTPKAQLAGMVILGIVVLVLGWFYFSSDPTLDFFAKSVQNEDSRPTPTSGESDGSKTQSSHSGDIFDQVAREQKNNPPLPHGYTFVDNSLPTGTLLGVETYNTGRGKITISNGTSEDAVVAVVVSSTGKLARKVYIAAASQYSLDKFSEGSYRVLFSLGKDWDPEAEVFKQDASYQEFGKILFFSEKELEDGVEYSHHTITLNPVPDGNVPRVDVDAAKFRAALLQN